ncbi:MAG: OsmC family protein [Candidatus Marinimicrobia bacterium]|nr:OsmC family protein [Candidatus Neomarinimicrobiota bacterium]MCF7828111.1 OsmC family protein [Candidatus Neomarinimicrobiota bacterium]MCF7879714.1 OsmC family protein [Candidatus Neomarinimicrobiota bacterium]
MAKPKRKFKTFKYETSVDWTGNRAGNLTAEGKPDVEVSSPPEFKGEAGKWSPEDLFVAAVESCTMTTFLALAFHKDLPLESYESSAVGTMENDGGGYEFTKIVVKPVVRVETEEAIDLAERLMEKAHDRCLISNSIKGKTRVEADIQSL